MSTQWPYAVEALSLLSSTNAVAAYVLVIGGDRGSAGCPVFKDDASPERMLWLRLELREQLMKELLAGLSLLDLCRLTLAKASGPEGLSLQGARSMKAETSAVKLVLRCKAEPQAKKRRATG